MTSCSLYARLKPFGPSGFGYGSTADEVVAGLDLRGKNVLITGVTSGLGQQTARSLGQRGARILGLARSQAAAEAALAGLPHRAVACDLAELATVDAAVAALAGERLDVIVCNAGIMALPTLQQKHGYELQFFTNHVGHFALVTGLLDQLAPDGRVVMVSSGAHRMVPPAGIPFDNLTGERGYNSTAYGVSKLANLLFAKELARRFAGTGRTASAVHPGVIPTALGRHMTPAMQAMVGFGFFVLGPLFLKNIPQGAATSCYAAVHPDAARHPGGWFVDCNVAAPSAHAEDAALAARLWEATEGIVAEVRREIVGG